MTVSMPGEGPTWRMNRVFHGELGRGRIYDYWEVTKAALECNRMPIVSVKSMRMAPPRPMPEPENRDPEEDYDWIQIPTEEIPELETDGFPNNQYPLYEEKNGWAPVYGIGEGNPNRPGHAMVISGYMIENEGPLEERYVRLLDPSPSMRLRANPMKMYEPDLFAKDPRNHIKWVRWRDLEAVIREQMGLLIFSADSRYFDPNLPTPAMEEYFLDSTTPDRSRGNVPIGW